MNYCMRELPGTYFTSLPWLFYIQYIHISLWPLPTCFQCAQWLYYAIWYCAVVCSGISIYIQFDVHWIIRFVFWGYISVNFCRKIFLKIWILSIRQGYSGLIFNVWFLYTHLMCKIFSQCVTTKCWRKNKNSTRWEMFNLIGRSNILLMDIHTYYSIFWCFE